MIDYVKAVNRQKGVVAIDVNVSYDGKIYEPHLRQLLEIGKVVQ